MHYQLLLETIIIILHLHQPLPQLSPSFIIAARYLLRASSAYEGGKKVYNHVTGYIMINAITRTSEKLADVRRRRRSSSSSSSSSSSAKEILHLERMKKN